METETTNQSPKSSCWHSIKTARISTVVPLIVGGIIAGGYSFLVWVTHPTGCGFELSEARFDSLGLEGGKLTTAFEFEGILWNPTTASVIVGGLSFELLYHNTALSHTTPFPRFLVEELQHMTIPMRRMVISNITLPREISHAL